MALTPDRDNGVVVVGEDVVVVVAVRRRRQHRDAGRALARWLLCASCGRRTSAPTKETTMTMLKKVLPLMLAVSALISAVACADEEGTEGEGETEGE